MATKSKSFWSTMPGLITGLAGILTALVGLGTLLIQIGVIGGDGDSTAKSGVTANSRGTEGGNSQTQDSETPPASAAKPSFTVAPDDLKLTGTDKEDTVTVSNTGTTALILATQVTGAGKDQFTVSKGSCGTQVPKGGSCSLTVSFKGALTPVKADLIVSASGASSSQEVKLEGSPL